MNRYHMRVFSSGHDYKAVQKSILSGYFTNVAKRDQEGYKTLLEGNLVYLHPSSSMKGREPEWVCYDQIKMTSREYMMNVMCTFCEGIVTRSDRPEVVDRAGAEVPQAGQRKDPVQGEEAGKAEAGVLHSFARRHVENEQKEGLVIPLSCLFVSCMLLCAFWSSC